jgi:hypothetical protein
MRIPLSSTNNTKGLLKRSFSMAMRGVSVGPMTNIFSSNLSLEYFLGCVIFDELFLPSSFSSLSQKLIWLAAWNQQNLRRIRKPLLTIFRKSSIVSSTSTTIQEPGVQNAAAEFRWRSLYFPLKKIKHKGKHIQNHTHTTP